MISGKGSSIQLAVEPRIEKIIPDLVNEPRAKLDRVNAEKEARMLLERLKGLDANMADFSGESLPPIVIVRGGRYVIYIVVFNNGYLLEGINAVKIIEELLPYIERIKNSKLNPLLLFYSRKGTLTTAAYLYLGSVIENHNIGILFVNGGPDEVVEIVWNITETGKYTVNEEELVNLSDIEVK